VRRWNVLLGAEHRQELRSEAARERLELVQRQRARIAADAALGPAVREPQQSAFPGHPHRQRRTLAEIDLPVVANAALGRPEHARVLHAIARNTRQRPLSSRTGTLTTSERSG